MSIFKASKLNPKHISVGAWIEIEGSVLLLKNDSSHSFMCGTVENNESLESTLHRELMEEMGAICSIKKYLGASVVDTVWQNPPYFNFEKCVIWFHCELISRGDQIDNCGEIVMVPIADLHGISIDEGRCPAWLLKNE